MPQPRLSIAGRRSCGFMHYNGLLLSGVLLLGCLLASSLSSLSYGQVSTTITADGTMGTKVGQVGTVYNIDGGRIISGTNQFHSFDRFSIGTGDTASFNGPSGIKNILSRVTGGSRSDIDGTLRSTIAGADVFLLNPNGVMFGRNASLDVQGSFHASTADYIAFSDGTRFNAIPSSNDALLTSAPPSAFGFLGTNVGQIDVQTGTFQGGRFTRFLQVPTGETLSFVGGTIRLGAANGTAPAYLLAPGGTVNLATAVSGEVALEGGGLKVDSAQLGGEIRVVGGSEIDGKEIFVRGGRLVIDNATLQPGLFSLANQGPAPNGGKVDIKVSNDVTISGTANDPFIGAPGRGIRTWAGRRAPGDVPDIIIEAGALTVSGVAVIHSERFDQGNPGQVVINADMVKVLDGASMDVINHFAGPGGSLTINAREVLLSENVGNARFTGLAAQSDFHPNYPRLSTNTALTSADAGTITVNATDKLTVRGGAEITTDSFAFGRAGDIIINAGDMFLSRDGANSGAIASQSILAGNAGNITINATGQIAMAGGFRISGSTGGSGDGGTVNVTAGQSITMSGTDTQISTSTRIPANADLDTFARVFSVLPQVCPSPCNYASLVNRASNILNIPNPTLFDVLRMLRDNFGLIAVDDLTVGNAGKLSVTTPLLTLNAGALMSSSTGWDGNAGEVVGNVGSLRVESGGEIRSRSGFPDPDTGQLLLGTGNAGSITFSATDTISISGGSISTSTQGAGNGGDIALNSAGTVQISNGGVVTADSLGGTGLAGNVQITAGDQIAMTDGSVSTRATKSDGGNITLNAPRMIQLTDSQVTTSVESGFGGGGNINIDPQALILNNSKILANAFGGPGGNINITADVFLVNSGGQFPTSLTGIVDASSALSTPGTVNIEATFTNVVGTFAQLPSAPLQASELLRASCAARFSGGKTSSLVLAGRDGLPLQPGGLLPSPLYVASDADTPSTGTRVTGYDQSLQFSLLGSKDRLLSQYSLLPNAKCAL